DSLGVRTECHAHDRRSVRLERHNLAASLRIPYLDFPHDVTARFAIIRATGRGQSLAIRAKNHTNDSTGIFVDRKHLLAARRIPYLHRISRRCRSRPRVSNNTSQPFAVRAESHASYIVGRSADRPSFEARGRIPNLDGPVPTARSQPRSVGTEG